MAALEITLLLLLFQITDFARTGSQLGEVGYFTVMKTRILWFGVKKKYKFVT